MAEHHIKAVRALGAELVRRGDAGWDESCPVAEILLNTTPPVGIDVVPHEGADPEKLQEIIAFIEKWDWGGRKPPKVTLANPWREPDTHE